LSATCRCRIAPAGCGGVESRWRSDMISKNCLLYDSA
jgi:hypothetical protein